MLSGKKYLFAGAIFLMAFLCFSSLKAAQSPADSIKTKKSSSPRHYFLPTFFGNWYSVGERALNDTSTFIKKNVNGNLRTFSYSQANTGFYIPLWTKDKYKSDSTIISNWHLLLTGNFQNSRPVFSGLPTKHIFVKYSVGLRTMYNNGKKDVFFFDFSPFVAFDKAYNADKDVRSASVFVWSHIFNEKVSLRVGIIKSFIFGDRITLPYIGARFGKLDRTYISIQFPRNIYLNVPLHRTVSFNLLAKPVGGVYNFKDVDSLYPGTNNNIIFGRRDICVGLGFDIHPSKYFTCFIHAGSATRNSSIVFYSKSSNLDNNVSPFNFFYHQKLRRSSFINFGVTFRFGKAKMAYGNRNIYELMNLNADIDPGDNNLGPNSSEITPNGDLKQINKLKYKDLADLIDDSDLYD